MLDNEIQDIKFLKESIGVLQWINSPSEAEQLSFVQNLKYTYNYDDFVYKYINSPKAIKLYQKLKEVYKVIK